MVPGELTHPFPCGIVPSGATSWHSTGPSPRRRQNDYATLTTLLITQGVFVGKYFKGHFSYKKLLTNWVDQVILIVNLR